ncbi:MAG: hypothetical protein KKF44_11510 [Nanoarchaeota archaeon]|nr:hypothetical protein [Nanoarchaeota archaeon]
MNILYVAQQRGSAEALLPIIVESVNRGHQASVVSTGNYAEKEGFTYFQMPSIINQALHYPGLNPEIPYNKLLGGIDVVVAGASGWNSAEAAFIKTAKKLHPEMKTVMVMDTPDKYQDRLGKNISELPDLIVHNEEKGIDNLEVAVSGHVLREAKKRSFIGGYTAFDNAIERQKYLQDNLLYAFREAYECKIGNKFGVYFSMNIESMPKREYLRNVAMTETIFKIAQKFGIRLLVHQHPKEYYNSINITGELAVEYGMQMDPYLNTNTSDLIFASDFIISNPGAIWTLAAALDKDILGLASELDRDGHYCQKYNSCMPIVYSMEEMEPVFEKFINADAYNEWHSRRSDLIESLNEPCSPIVLNT